MLCSKIYWKPTIGEDAPGTSLPLMILFYWIKYDEIWNSRFMFKASYTYENALICKEVFLEKAIAKMSNKMVVFLLINPRNDTMSLKFYYVISFIIYIYILYRN